MKSRRANAVLFGFDFQRNAAIVLMLENIKDLRSVRLEGNEEDIYDYTQFPSAKKQMEKCQDFIDHSWKDYKSEFSSDGIDDETLEAITKIVLYNVIRRRITIDKVRQGVDL